MAELIAREGLSKPQAGLIGTLFFVVYGVCQLLSGFLGDRISPKKLIFTGVTGSALLNLGMGLSGASYPVMLALWTLNGVFQSLLWSPAASAPARTRARPIRSRRSRPISSPPCCSA